MRLVMGTFVYAGANEDLKSGQTHLTFQEAIGTNKKVKILIFSI